MRVVHVTDSVAAPEAPAADFVTSVAAVKRAVTPLTLRHAHQTVFAGEVALGTRRHVEIFGLSCHRGKEIQFIQHVTMVTRCIKRQKYFSFLLLYVTSRDQPTRHEARITQ